MLRKERIQVISHTRERKYVFQEDNQLEDLSWELRLSNMERHGKVTKYQAMNTEQLKNCVSQ